MRLLRSLLIVLAVSTLDMESCIAADAQVERLRQAVQRAQNATRQAEQERAALLKEKQELQEAAAKSEQQSSGLAQQLGVLREALAVEKARSVKLAEESEAARKLGQQQESTLRNQSTALDDARKLAMDLSARIKELQRNLDERVAEGVKFGAENERTKKELAACERDNSGLYQVSVELAEKFTGLSYWDGVMRREPLFRFERVELENLMDRYRDEIEKRRR